MNFARLTTEKVLINASKRRRSEIFAVQQKNRSEFIGVNCETADLYHAAKQ